MERIIRNICFVALCCFQLLAVGQIKEKPKMVVGIVVDQMRLDYIYRYWDRFGDDGFKKLINEGAFCSNTHYNYVPTFTGPGHASIFSGATPANHGIVSNDWFERTTNERMYCVKDKDVIPVGTTNNKAKRSPKNLLSSNICDELELATNGKSITIGISLKDRGAILPAGHAADGAYWMEEGIFVSSSWYMETLPKWVEKFNSSGKIDDYIEQGWETMYPINTYNSSVTDKNPWEKEMDSKVDPTFPYPLAPEAMKNGKDVIKKTGLGNEYLADFAIHTIKNLPFGKDEYADFLAISFSATDYVGHGFGPQSIEAEDTYLRLDKALGRVLKALEQKVGEDIVIFLTADHGGMWNPGYMNSHLVPGGNYERDSIDLIVLDALNKAHLDSGIISYCSDGYIYFSNNAKPNERKRAFTVIRQQLMSMDGVRNVINLRTPTLHGIPPGYQERLENGYYAKRSADMLIIYEPGWIEYGSKGTTHGSGYDYDTHVPLIWYGKGIKKKEVLQRVWITDIAPTVCNILRIANPSASIGDPIRWVLK